MFPSELQSSWILLLFLALGFGLLLVGGWLLVEGAVRAAERMKVSKLVVGLTVVAFGTSSPELVFNIFAAVDGSTGLAYGNVVGSNIANIGLVIGLSALAAPLVLTDKFKKRGLPFLVAITFIFALLWFIAWLLSGEDGVATFSWHYGVVLLAILAILSWLWVNDVKKEKKQRREDARDDKDYEQKRKTAGDFGFPVGPTPEGEKEQEQTPFYKFLISWISLFAGLALLLLGGWLAEKSAEILAGKLGVSDAVIGLTIIAIATTLPEIITCVIAAYKRHSDLVMGTVIGSNLCNMLLVMGVTSIIHKVPMNTSIGSVGGDSMVAMLVFTVMLLLFARVKQGNSEDGASGTVTRWEGGILVAVYVGTLAWLVVGTTA